MDGIEGGRGPLDQKRVRAKGRTGGREGERVRAKGRREE
jgi:hypothetical protein